MGVVIGYLTEKGGVGRSSNVYLQSFCFASQGRKVLVVDMDGQRANITHYFGVKKSDGMYTVLNVLQGTVNAKDAIVHINENIDVIPANSQISGIDQTIKVTRMKRMIENLRPDYDYIFFDVSPTPNWIHFLVASASDYLILVQLPDAACLEAIMGVAETIDEVREVTNPNLKVLGILINQNTSRTNLSKLSKQTAEKMARSLGTSVFNASIRISVQVSECEYKHVGIEEYNPSSPVAADVKALCQEIEERLGAINGEK